MYIDQKLKERLGIALNEASLLGIELDRETNEVGCSFEVVAIDKDGRIPDDNRVLFVFKNVGRFVASLRKGSWEDLQCNAESIEPEDLLTVIQELYLNNIYGWDFINCGDANFDKWKDRLSFDYKPRGIAGMTNTIDLFAEGENKVLDIRIWFDELDILTPQYQQINLEDFLENGMRGWDAIYGGQNSEVMNRYGIIPLADANKKAAENWWQRLKSMF